MRLGDWLVGVNPFPSTLDYKTALLRAYLSVVAITVALLYIIIDSYYHILGNAHYYIAVIIAALATLILNRMRKAVTATTIFMVAINAVVFLFADKYPYYTGIYIYFICISLTAFALFGNVNKPLAILFSLISFSLFLIAYWNDTNVINTSVIPPEFAQIYLTVNVAVAFVTCISIIYFLISINHHTEMLLQKQNKELAQANSELDQFAYSVSHDLRAPLSSVLGLINLYRLSSGEKEKDSVVDLIQGRINTLDQFIRDILDNSRNSRMEVSLQKVNLSDLTEQVIAQLSHMKEFGKQRIIVDIPDPFLVATDMGRLKMVLSNLISNAIKYYDPAKPNAYIRITAGIENAHWYLNVEDNGLGVSEEHKKHLFDMFYRAHAHAEGSGLGLYIVNEVCKKLGGKVSLKSAYGQGSSFTVEFPLLRQTEDGISKMEPVASASVSKV